MRELDSASFDGAIRGELPAVVDFWAEWCMPCKIFSPVLQEASDLLDGKADFYKLNIDDHAEIAGKFGITSIPTIILFKDGKEIERMIGVRSKDDVIEMVQKNL